MKSMGGVAILHPQPYLKDAPVKLLPTEMKSRRVIKFKADYTNPASRNPSFNVPDSRRRTPTKGILKKGRNTEAVVTDAPAAADVSSKNLVMGQIKILKRGEVLSEPSTVLKDVNDRKVSNGAASTPPEVSRVPSSDRRVLNANQEAEKDENWISNSGTKPEDITLSSTDRLGPDPELVSKQMNLTEFFAGSAFADSPPPSSVPLPGFSIRKLGAAMNDKTNL